MKKRLLALSLALVATLLLFAGESAAQQLSLSGTVRDTTGVVPGATVILNAGGNQVSAQTSDANGAYRFSSLAAGSYELSIAMKGFETAVRNVALSSNTGPVDVVLAIGRISTTLTVTASAGRATATRLPVADDDVPVQVSSIPQELLRQQSINSIGDAIRNASGVQSFRWYGAYEQFTIRGFNDPDRDEANVMLIDGMRMAGNRYATQTNNVESIEVLKGPSSVLYGRGAAGGSINIVRKKPQTQPAYEFGYKIGRFNTQQFFGGATGTFGSDRVLYRADLSFEHTDGWRKAGGDRFDISPALTWLINDKARLTIHETIKRDRFDGDGGVPLNITGLPSYRSDLRFSLPQDNVLVEDSQTQFLLDVDISPRLEFRNAFSAQRTSDRYFVTEGLYGDPSANEVYREPLDFHHNRRPWQNQSEVVGKFDGFGRHTVLAGYEFQRDRYRTDVTAGDDPDCLCGYWWLTIPTMNVSTMKETQATALDITTVERQTSVNDQIHAVYFQDQIDVLPQLKFNVSGRFDDYERRITRTGGLPFKPQARDQTAYTYRAGVVYAPRYDHQFYFNTASSFSPVNTVPADGSALKPRTARNYEVGHRWQGLNGRVDTSLAVYYIIRNNLNVQQSVTTFIQVGEQRSRGLDLDVNTDLGWGTHLIANYGFTQPRFEDPGALNGLMPRYVPKHTGNAWLRKDWRSGFSASIGARVIGDQFADNANKTRLGGYTIFSGAVGYRANRWDWSLNAENLFDKERYFIPGHFSNQVFPGQPINVSTSIRFRFL